MYMLEASEQVGPQTPRNSKQSHDTFKTSQGRKRKRIHENPGVWQL